MRIAPVGTLPAAIALAAMACASSDTGNASSSGGASGSSGSAPSPVELTGARCENGAFRATKGEDVTATFFSALWPSTKGVWIAGGDHTANRAVVWKADGTRFQASELLPLDNSTGLWGTSERDVWLTTAVHDFEGSVPFSRGYLIHWSGSGEWIEENEVVGSGRALNAIHGRDGAVFIVGDHGFAARRVSGTWRELSTETTEELFGVSVAASDDAWAVGAKGTVLHWDGTGWSAKKAPTTETLRGVHARTATDVWIVGENGTRIHWDGAAFRATSDEATPDGVTLTAVWSLSDRYAVAVGGRGTYLVWDGQAWAPQETDLAGSTETFLAVTGTDECTIWAAGTGLNLVRFDGDVIE